MRVVELNAPAPAVGQAVSDPREASPQQAAEKTAAVWKGYPTEYQDPPARRCPWHQGLEGSQWTHAAVSVQQ
eukprot:2178332-Amphidinium_carterae.1